MVFASIVGSDYNDISPLVVLVGDNLQPLNVGTAYA